MVPNRIRFSSIGKGGSGAIVVLADLPVGAGGAVVPAYPLMPLSAMNMNKRMLFLKNLMFYGANH